MDNKIDFSNIKWFAYILLNKFEIWFIIKMFEFIIIAANKIVDDYYVAKSFKEVLFNVLVVILCPNQFLSGIKIKQENIVLD